MINVAIFGAGTYGRQFVELQKCMELIHVKAYCDNNVDLHGETIAEIPVIRIDELAEMYHHGQIDAVVITMSSRYHDSVLTQLRQERISEVYVVPDYYFLLGFNTVDLDRTLIKIDTTKPTLPYVEYHVTDHCNLNCKGCGHLSNSEPTESFGDLEQFHRDMQQLSKLYWNIQTIRLMGGEPLLNSQLDQFLYTARTAFPAANIFIVSNGLLIPRMSFRLIRAIKENGVAMHISNYPPTQKIWEQIKTFLEENQISYFLLNPVTAFYKLLLKKEKKGNYESYCLKNDIHCSFLRDGYLAICPFILLSDKFKRFGVVYDTAEDKIDLYDPALDGWKINKWQETLAKSCRYCADEPVFFPWEISRGAVLEDHIIM